LQLLWLCALVYWCWWLPDWSIGGMNNDVQWTAFAFWETAAVLQKYGFGVSLSPQPSALSPQPSACPLPGLGNRVPFFLARCWIGPHWMTVKDQQYIDLVKFHFIWPDLSEPEPYPTRLIAIYTKNQHYFNPTRPAWLPSILKINIILKI
jgi:hypothetical protein